MPNFNRAQVSNIQPRSNHINLARRSKMCSHFKRQNWPKTWHLKVQHRTREGRIPLSSSLVSCFPSWARIRPNIVINWRQRCQHGGFHEFTAIRIPLAKCRRPWRQNMADRTSSVVAMSSHFGFLTICAVVKEQWKQCYCLVQYLKSILILIKPGNTEWIMM